RLPTSTSASSPPVGRNPRPTIEKRVDFSFFAPLAGPSAVGQPYHTNARHRCRHPRFACNKDTSQNAGVELVFDTAPSPGGRAHDRPVNAGRAQPRLDTITATYGPPTGRSFPKTGGK